MICHVNRAGDWSLWPWIIHNPHLALQMSDHALLACHCQTQRGSSAVLFSDNGLEQMLSIHYPWRCPVPRADCQSVTDWLEANFSQDQWVMCDPPLHQLTKILSLHFAQQADAVQYLLVWS